MASCTTIATGGVPSAASSAASDSRFSRRRPVTATRAPSRARLFAMARPMPELAPVTSAVRPSSCRSIKNSGSKPGTDHVFQSANPAVAHNGKRGLSPVQVLVHDLDVLLVEPLGEGIEERRGDLHLAALGKLDVALALRVAVADGDVAAPARVLREERLELRRIGLPVDR